MTDYNKNNPFLAKIKARYRLNKPGSKKQTYHVVLDISNSGIEYRVGDSIGIIPINDPTLVEKTLHAMQAWGEESIADKHSTEILTLREFLTRKANITEISRKFLQEISNRDPNPASKQKLDHLLAEENREFLKEYIEHHELWDILKHHADVIFEPQELCNFLMPLLPRFYSIASSPKMHKEEIHMTVAIVKYESAGEQRSGVCTHYICHLAPIDEPVVPIYIQPSNGFTLPENPEIPIIMIGPGTGIAPFVSFVQDRITSNAPGKNWLFFGEWTSTYDFFYEDYWNEMVAIGKLKLDAAFSRDQSHKVYVQDKLKERGLEFYKWIEEGAYIYVCGDAHQMARDVEATMLQIFRDYGNMDEIQAKAFLKQLRKDKRYLRDVY